MTRINTNKKLVKFVYFAQAEPERSERQLVDKNMEKSLWQIYVF